MIKCDASLEGIQRTAGLVAASSDYTCMFLVDLLSNGGNQQTLFFARNTGDGSQFIRIERRSTTVIRINVGGTTADTGGQDRVPLWIWYVRTGTSHKLYVMGTEQASVTVDISSWTLDEVYLGTDNAVAGNWKAGNYMTFREWSVAKTPAQLRAEVNSASAVSTTSLTCDTPLASDLLDDSGNGSDWSAIGSTSFFTSGGPLDLTQPVIDFTVTQSEFNAGDRLIYSFAASVDRYIGFRLELVGSDIPGLVVNPPDQSVAASFRIDQWAAWFKAFANTVYTFRITNLSASSVAADFDVHFEQAPEVPEPMPRGSILINDDTGGIPATAWTADGEFLGFVEGIPGGEIGAGVDDGHTLWHDRYQERGNYLALLDPSFALVSSFNLPSAIDDDPFPRITTYNGDFYVLNVTTQELFKVTTAGVVTGPVATLTTINTAEKRTYCAVAISPDGSILYYTLGNGDASIKRWDLGANSAMADLYTIPGFVTGTDRLAGTAFNHAGDILALSDGSVVTWWRDASPTALKLLHIAADGTLLAEHSYNATTSQINHLARAGSVDAVRVWFLTDFAEQNCRIATVALADASET